MVEPSMMRVETPAARNTDPQPSHDAAEAITASGIRRASQLSVLQAVRAWPGRTSRELAHLSGQDRHEVARRLSELVTAGVIHHGAPKVCQFNRVGTRKALTWWPV